MNRHSQKLGFINQRNPQSGMLLVFLLFAALALFRDSSHRSPAQIVAFLASFTIATSIHEFCHAYVALKLGDHTAADLGRVTLNPVAHFDPFGFFGMVMISIGYGFIGWGKPVPVNPARFTNKRLRHHRHGMAIVAVAGPISNLIQASVVAIPLRIAGVPFNDFGLDSGFGMSAWTFVYVNLLLAAFNMIPIPPLDGSKLLLGIVPKFWYGVLAPLEQYGYILLMGIFFLPIFIGGNFTGSIVSALISPPLNLFSRVIIGFELGY
jgi:Zn-dependent protease